MVHVQKMYVDRTPRNVTRNEKAKSAKLGFFNEVAGVQPVKTPRL
jgi:hypothetical protein